LRETNALVKDFSFCRVSDQFSNINAHSHCTVLLREFPNVHLKIDVTSRSERHSSAETRETDDNRVLETCAVP